MNERMIHTCLSKGRGGSRGKKLRNVVMYVRTHVRDVRTRGEEVFGA